MHFISKEIEDYCERYSRKEDAVLQSLSRQTQLKTIMPQMLSGALQGNFLRFFVAASNARSILEVGTFTGYSAIQMASAMPADGKLITMDINEELEEICRRHFQEAGLQNRIDYRLGNALELIPTLTETFDLMFLDADKENYPNYKELLYPKLRMGGWMLADNVLWSGKVMTDADDRDSLALKRYNEEMANDSRFEVMILPLRDGISIARKIA